MAQFGQNALQSRLLGSPNVDHFITLSRINVQRALIGNVQAVRMNVDWMQSNATFSRFNLARPELLTDHIPSN